MIKIKNTRMKKLFIGMTIFLAIVLSCKREQDMQIPEVLTDISIAQPAITLNVGTSMLLVAEPVPVNAHNASFSWESEDKNVATVSSSGWVWAKKRGTTHIVVRSNGIEKKIPVTVRQDLEIPMGAVTYAADTLDYEEVAPGIKWLKFKIPEFVNDLGTLGKGLVVNVLEVDVTIPGNKIEVWAALPSKQVNRERPSAVHSRKIAEYNAQGRKPVAVINGDYYLLPATNTTGYAYIDNRPHGMEAVNGMLTQTPNFWSNGLVIENNGKAAHGNVSFSGQVDAGSSTFPLKEVNGYAGSGELVLFNNLASAYATNAPFAWSPYTSIMVSLSQPAGGWRINERMEFTVTAVEHDIETTIPAQTPYKGKDFTDQGAILVGNGSASGNSSRAFLSNFKPGDKIGIKTDIKLNDKMITDPRSNIIGYQAAILEQGVPVNPFNDIHPRTAVGYSEDGTKIYLIVIDGRQANYSVGVTTGQIGYILKALGSYSGVNLDGGGSTCMTVNGQIKNRPSDGSERAVANGILVTTNK